MNAIQRQLLERLENHRLESQGDDYAYAWDAAGLASELRKSGPTPEAFSVAWVCYEVALCCERRLEKARCSANTDTGQSPSQRIKSYLDGMSSRILDRGRLTA